jgi:deoxyadenosine/deoxycytidine kinase
MVSAKFSEGQFGHYKFRPHPRLPVEMPRPILVTVDAPIAAGKTTLVERLLRKLKWRVIVAEEPVGQWQASGLLADMYKSLRPGQPNPDGMPGMFQIYAFVTRSGVLAEAMREATRISDDSGEPVIVLSERSVFTDRAVFKHMLAESGHITETQTRVYEGCYTALINQIVPEAAPDLSIWINTPIDECVRRQIARNRDGESVSVEYATSLHERHVELFGGKTARFGTADVPVLQLDGTQPFHTDDTVLKRVTDSIEHAITNTNPFRKISMDSVEFALALEPVVVECM